MPAFVDSPRCHSGNSTLIMSENQRGYQPGMNSCCGGGVYKVRVDCLGLCCLHARALADFSSANLLFFFVQPLPHNGVDVVPTHFMIPTQLFHKHIILHNWKCASQQC